jgi:heptosyltransferase-2
MPNEPFSFRNDKSKTIVYGAFKGMGDLLCASPVIASELAKGHTVKLLLSSPALSSFVGLIDFGPNRDNLQSFQIPVSFGLAKPLSFLKQMASFDADLIWISPHAPRKASTWKVPLLFWFLKMLCWPNAVLAGAFDEKLSSLFDSKVPLDRSLPLALREWIAYSLLGGKVEQFPGFASFIDRITLQKKHPPTYDLLIAPGASAANRLWPLAHYASLIQLIPADCRIAVLGLPSDIKRMHQVLPQNRQIEYLSGSVEKAISFIAQSRVVLTLDSGSMHFAQALNVPGIALFGKDDPATVISTGGSIFPIYEKKFPCQPCNSVHCSEPEIYCMDSIRPEIVAAALIRLLQDFPMVIG